jgi:hypothetical protein
VGRGYAHGYDPRENERLQDQASTRGVGIGKRLRPFNDEPYAHHGFEKACNRA